MSFIFLDSMNEFRRGLENGLTRRVSRDHMA
jgi:hypothetical protein